MEQTQGRAQPITLMMLTKSQKAKDKEQEYIRTLTRMESVRDHCKICVTVPLHDSTHYSEDEIRTSKDLVDMANQNHRFS